MEWCYTQLITVHSAPPILFLNCLNAGVWCLAHLFTVHLGELSDVVVSSALTTLLDIFFLVEPEPIASQSILILYSSCSVILFLFLTLVKCITLELCTLVSAAIARQAIESSHSLTHKLNDSKPSLSLMSGKVV